MHDYYVESTSIGESSEVLMWSTWSQLAWVDPVKRKWDRLSIEDREVLQLAFQQAVDHPERATHLKLKIFRSAPGREYWTQYDFRIGYARWVLIAAVKCVAPIDFELDASIAIAAE